MAKTKTPDEVKQAFVTMERADFGSDAVGALDEAREVFYKHFPSGDCIAIPSDITFAVGEAVYSRFENAVDCYLKYRGDEIGLSYSMLSRSPELVAELEALATSAVYRPGCSARFFYVRQENRPAFEAAIRKQHPDFKLVWNPGK